MKDEEIKKDSDMLLNVIKNILFIHYDKVNSAMTTFGYMVMKFILLVAKGVEHDPDEEMDRFLKFLKDIYENDKKINLSENKADIINLN